ncbi:MAG: DUF4416 family protein [Pirellulales bacterium]|nr:DUF4416 family protein [Pirellulales bacterium]
MGDAALHPPVLPLLVLFSADPAALAWARDEVVAAWGPVALASPRFEFAETDYYAASMGHQLQLEILAFERLMPPDELPARKRQTNAWEAAYAQKGSSPSARPVNLDPGYLTPAKFVLASTKDHSHRLYLGQGIFGEVTLYYSRGAWQSRPWTYPNYQRADYQEFLTACRSWLRQHESKGPSK